MKAGSSDKRIATLEILGCGQILSGILWPGLEADNAMTIQLFVDPDEMNVFAELSIRDPMNSAPRGDTTLSRVVATTSIGCKKRIFLLR